MWEIKLKKVERFSVEGCSSGEEFVFDDIKDAIAYEILEGLSIDAIIQK